MTPITLADFEFESERLHLRPLRAGDATLFRELYTDAETMRFIGEPMTPERAARSCRKAAAALGEYPLHRAFLAVVEKATQQVLGICAVVQFDAGRRRAEVGIMLKSEARCRGLAREGLGRLVNETWRLFPVDEIWVECSALNPVVERMVSSIGFKLVDGSASGRLSKRIWSIHRSSWDSAAPTNEGGNNVERHQVS